MVQCFGIVVIEKLLYAPIFSKSVDLLMEILQFRFLFSFFKDFCSSHLKENFPKIFKDLTIFHFSIEREILK